MRRLEKYVVVPALWGGAESIHWFLFARLSLVFAALTALVISEATERLSAPFAQDAYALFAGHFAFTLASSIVIDRMASNFRSASLQILFDALMAGLWLRVIGHDANIMALLFVVQIFAAALTFYKRGAWLSAVSVTVAFATAAAHHTHPLTITTFGTLFLIIGTAGGYLASELSRTTRVLAKKEKTIAKLTELQEQILTDLPTGLLTVDSELVVNFVNPAALSILDRPASDLVGRPLAETAPELLPFFSSIEIESLDPYAQKPEDLEPATQTGSHRSVFVHSKNDRKRLGQRVEVGEGRRVLRGDVANLGGAIEGSGLLQAHATEGQLVLFQDVTVVDGLEERLRQNEKLAAVGQLAAGIAHEIRNPLASMSASIEMLRESSPGAQGHENQRLMEITIREIDRLNELVTEFLEYVKPEKPKRADINLGALVEELAQAMRRRKDWPATAELSVLATNLVWPVHREKMAQVLLNLLLNALQAIGPRGKIEVGCRQGGDEACLWVRDDGCGMKESVKSHLFEPFFTTKPKGTGLGLATVYKIVESHGGTITVKSEVDKGSLFEIRLPGVRA